MSRVDVNRISYIDASRGIGDVCVVVDHMTDLDQGIGQYIYSFHMPLFFILSGMLLF